MRAKSLEGHKSPTTSVEKEPLAYMNKTLKISIALAVTAALVLPSAALAQSGQEGYGGPNNVVSGIQGGGGDDTTPPSGVNVVSDTAADDGGSLPFTGADLGVLATAGALMLLLGFGLRRFTHRPSES